MNNGASHVKDKTPGRQVKVTLTPEHFSAPVLEKLNNLAVQLLGMRLVIVYPTENGLEQIAVGTNNYMNRFCKMIQSTADGANLCRMCHLVMTRSSRATTTQERRCHTGASAMVRLVSGEEDSSLAVLSSCCFTDQDVISSWPVARRRAKELGLDEDALKEAYQDMVRLDPEKLKLMRQIIDIAGDTLNLIMDKIEAQAALREARKPHSPDQAVTNAVEHALNHAITTLKEGKAKKTRKRPAPAGGATVINVISELVAHKPYLPFTLRAVAAAIQLTPNHFSYLFHKQHKVCFSEYLTEQRLDYSKLLLKDLTLNIARVASKAGFHDAGYFARRFKQRTGLSPREWRQKLESA